MGIGLSTSCSFEVVGETVEVVDELVGASASDEGSGGGVGASCGVKKRCNSGWFLAAISMRWSNSATSGFGGGREKMSSWSSVGFASATVEDAIGEAKVTARRCLEADAVDDVVGVKGRLELAGERGFRELFVVASREKH